MHALDPKKSTPSVVAALSSRIRYALTALFIALMIWSWNIIMFVPLKKRIQAISLSTNELQVIYKHPEQEVSIENLTNSLEKLLSQKTFTILDCANFARTCGITLQECSWINQHRDQRHMFIVVQGKHKSMQNFFNLFKKNNIPADLVSFDYGHNESDQLCTVSCVLAFI